MGNPFLSLYKFIVRAIAFVSKEMTEVLRQTPLILTLVLGPFLILLLFGIGYKNEARTLRTLVVMNQNDPAQQQFVDQVMNFGLNLVSEGTTNDREAALRELHNGQVDLVAVIPDNATQTIQNNQQAVVEFYHNEIDPYQVSYVEYISSAYVEEVNRMVVRGFAEQGQENAGTLEQKIADARQRIQTTREALQAGNALAAQGEQQQLGNDLDAISLLVGGSMSILSGIDGQDSGTPSSASPEDQAILDTLSKLQQSRQDVSNVQENQTSYDEYLQKLDQMDSDMNDLETQLKDFQSITPDVLVKPFRSQTQGTQGNKLRPADFFAPAAVVLLLQHLAVTFAAMAIVREQRSGTMELFRISPLGALETLLGKYLSYLIFGAIVGGVITATVIFFMKVPMLGSWANYALVLLVLLFTAMGVGFMISLFAKTEMQAVQYSMFVLLGSVFFSGFFLDLRYLWTPVQTVSWMLPATYAIRLLQSVMLRGYPIDATLFYLLLAIGIVLFVFTMLLLRRRMQREWS
jgi:ABC-2 type transport system permease protein